MDRFIDVIEGIAALFVGLVAADIFISVVLRAFFAVQIPDSYDFGRMLLGILIFWGIAATSYRGTHITVDLFYASVGDRAKRAIDVFATSVLLFVVVVQTYTLFDKVRQTRVDNVLTYDLNLPTWPFFALAWAGDVSAVLLIAIRTWRLIFQPESMSHTVTGRRGGVMHVPSSLSCPTVPGTERASSRALAELWGPARASRVGNDTSAQPAKRP